MRSTILVRLNVRNARAECALRGWGVDRLATEAGINVSTARRAMKGGLVTNETVEKIAQALRAYERQEHLAGLVATR